ncbi:MAG: hypothetical protein IT462_11570 [Planctomycetes bacterium]|nr:hypothetical protein [Planctomycetota bacterium]
MLLRPENLKCHLADDYGTRYALHCIALGARGSISSDGRFLLFVPYPPLDPADAPLIEGVDAKSPSPEVEPFLVKTDEAAGAVGALLPKKGKNDDAYYWTQVIQGEVAGDGLMLATTDLESARSMVLQRTGGEFPNVGGVIPDYSEAVIISLDLNRLLKLIKTLRAASKSDVVTLRIIDTETGVNFSCNDGVAGLLMPFEPPHAPDGLAVLRDPNAAAQRDMEVAMQMAAAPQPESEMLPPAVFATSEE